MVSCNVRRHLLGTRAGGAQSTIILNHRKVGLWTESGDSGIHKPMLETNLLFPLSTLGQITENEKWEAVVCMVRTLSTTGVMQVRGMRIAMPRVREGASAPWEPAIGEGMKDKIQ